MTTNIAKRAPKNKPTSKTAAVAKSAPVAKKSTAKKTVESTQAGIIWVTLDQEGQPNGVFSSRSMARGSDRGSVHKFIKA